MLVITAGHPGTGKTTLCRPVARRTGATHLRIDTIRRAESRPEDIPGLVRPTWPEIIASDHEAWTRDRMVIDTARMSVPESVERLARAMDAGRTMIPVPSGGGHMSQGPQVPASGLPGGLTPMSERAALVACLDAERAHVLESLSGLSDEALRRPVLPSGWSCLGLVQHLTLDVERFWFRAVVAGEQVDLKTGDGAWQVGPDTEAETVLDAYRAEVRLADAVIAATPLDAAPAWWPEQLFEALPVRDLRRTILSVLTETACHAGHLDVVRELIDGRQRLVLT